MSLDDRFLFTTPPRIHTFSNREAACRYETSLRSGTLRKPCPFRSNGYCDGIRKSALKEMLGYAYREPTRNILSEPSTSVVVRSEQQFHGRDRERFSQRRHLSTVYFASPQEPIVPEETRTDCVPNLRDANLGEYLGFVDLRQYYTRSPLALGFLIPPRHLQNDPGVQLIQGEYAPLFGGHSFLSSVYATQDPHTIGAKCAQMCAIMATGMLSDRKAEVKGSYTLTYLGALATEASKKRQTFEEISADIDSSADISPQFAFPIRGLTPKQLRDVLNLCNVKASLLYLPASGALGLTESQFDRLLLRLVEAYVFANFPIIFAVDSHRWWRGNPNMESPPHGVVLAGVRIASEGDPTHIIVHDPGRQPFLVTSTSNLLESCRACFADKGDYCMVCCGDYRLRRHVYECIKQLIDRDDDWEFVNLLKSNDPGEYKVRLVDRHAVFGSVLPPEKYDVLAKTLEKRFPARSWMIADLRGRNVRRLWLFDAEGESKSFQFRVDFSNDEIDRFTYVSPSGERIQVEV